jgi:ribulose-phosphate 3-epimerase
MLISPSIASSDVLHVAEEVDFCDKYFGHVHLDVEDGVAVNNLSFGMKMCKLICQRSSSFKSLHLEVLHPLDYLKDMVVCGADIVFIQTDHLENPIEVVSTFQSKGINTGLSLSNRDFNKDISALVEMTNSILVLTAKVEDPLQKYDINLENFALEFAKKGKSVWIDGGVNLEVFKRLKNSQIYAAVMGRGVFADKESAIENYC